MKLRMFPFDMGPKATNAEVKQQIFTKGIQINCQLSYELPIPVYFNSHTGRSEKS